MIASLFLLFPKSSSILFGNPISASCHLPPMGKATIRKASPYFIVNLNKNSEMRARQGERAFPEGVYNEVND
jgi:hypothetical protein